MKIIFTTSIFLVYTALALAQRETLYFENGNKKYEEEKKDGHFVGKRIWWYENGEKKSAGYYNKQGVLIRSKQWDSTGTLIIDHDFKKWQNEKGKTDLSHVNWDVVDSICISYTGVGLGNQPSKGDTVTLHYIGYFENGEQFDNSFDRQEPLSFTVGSNYLLKSFAKAIATFKRGQQGYIKIPPQYAYGNKPSGNIPANSTLVYFVDIINIR